MIGRPNTASVRFRATALASAALAVLVVGSALAINLLVTREVTTAADNVLLEQAEDRAQLLAGGAPPASLVTVVGEEVVAAVIDPSGQVLASSGTADLAPLTTLQPGLATVSIVVEEKDEHDGSEAPHAEDLRVAVAGVPDGSLIVVGNEGEEARRTLGAIRLVLAVASPLIVVLGGLILWLLTGRALGPVYRMRDDLGMVVAAGTGGRVTEPGTGDEVDDLARTLNGVLGRLEQQSQARRRFVADASHELKSPVANARVLVETAGPPAQVLGELDRLQALVEDLLFLARTDETAPRSTTIVDLDDVVFDEAERASVRTSIPIDASAVQPAQIMADRNEVARAVRNLVENAVRHGHRQVALAIEAIEGHWVLTVTDDGPGIPADDRERIFERFARLADERSRGDGGTGLGLSIVAAIAGRHGGAVAVVDHDGPGAQIELAFPVAAATGR